MKSDDPGRSQLTDGWHLTVPDPARSVAHLLPPALQGHVNLTAVSARYLAVVEAPTADQLRRTAAASALDVPALVSEVDRLTWMLVRTRRRYANLAAAARTALAADADGDRDPWAYLRDELDHPSPHDLWLPRGPGDHTPNVPIGDEGGG
jgi:hypothetical protein